MQYTVCLQFLFAFECTPTFFYSISVLPYIPMFQHMSLQTTFILEFQSTFVTLEPSFISVMCLVYSQCFLGDEFFVTPSNIAVQKTMPVLCVCVQFLFGCEEHFLLTGFATDVMLLLLFTRLNSYNSHIQMPFPWLSCCFGCFS